MDNLENKFSIYYAAAVKYLKKVKSTVTDQKDLHKVKNMGKYYKLKKKRLYKIILHTFKLNLLLTMCKFIANAQGISSQVISALRACTMYQK